MPPNDSEMRAPRQRWGRPGPGGRRLAPELGHGAQVGDQAGRVAGDVEDLREGAAGGRAPARAAGRHRFVTAAAGLGAGGPLRAQAG